MANMLTTHTVRSTIYPTTDDDRTVYLVARKMIEQYCDRKFPLSEISAEYSIDTNNGPLLAVDNYQINFVHEVTDNTGQQQQEFYASDEAVYPKLEWSRNPILVRYTGGLPSQVFDAIKRQAEVLQTRPNVAPEIGDSSIPYDVKFNVSMRSGLAPDIKQMVFPYKVIGF